MLNDLIGVRRRRKFSQSQVANAIGINRSGISRFESDIEGSNPTLDTILRYAQAVGASVHLHVEPVERVEQIEARNRRAHWRASTAAAPSVRTDPEKKSYRVLESQGAAWVTAEGSAG
ncbi:helix-turn-helix transcriptional regulator [Nocardia sp. NPDC050697]|uniref:helix-turn-helix domain-containing protein n=1 Tax=Nocardia sp. NPDC050697 TaxID=3155158 RepID=UPI0033F802CD